jgi:hypothetical protein
MRLRCSLFLSNIKPMASRMTSGIRSIDELIFLLKVKAWRVAAERA